MPSGEERKRLSKLMSYLLRHNPSEAGLELDRRGFVALEALLEALSGRLRFAVTAEDIETLTRPSADPRQKQRFELEGGFVRAGHGHSIPIEGYEVITPTAPLYHATIQAALPGIQEKGLLAMARQKVHLAHDRDITCEAARRRGKAIVLLEVLVEEATRAGVGFYRSADPRIVLSDDLAPRLVRVVE